MQCQSQPQQGRGHGQGRRRWVRISLLACAVSGAVLAGALFPVLLGGSSGGAVAFACGLGNSPTMMANNAPALLFPITKNVPASQPVGLFALTYVAGQPISFQEDLSRVVGAPDPTSLQWRWNFGDGPSTSSEISPQHTFAKPGTYNVHAQIFDTSSKSWTDLDSAQITVIAAAQPNPPVAQITASGTIVSPGGTITFDGGNSQAADGSKLTYLWNFNDGSTATGPHVTHTFAITGHGVVALIVTDTHGARAVATVNIAVLSTFPTAKVSANSLSVIPGGSVSFNASKSAPSDEPGDRIASYTWNFGDGSAKVTTQGPTTSHRYVKPGTYTVSIQAFDVLGASGTTHLTVTVGFSPVMIGGAIAAVLLVWGVGYLIVSGRRRTSLAQAHAARDAERELARSRRVGAGRTGQSAAARPRSAGGAPPAPARGDRRGPPPGAGDAYRGGPPPGASSSRSPRGDDSTGRYPQRGGPPPRVRRDRQEYDDGDWGSSSPRRPTPDGW
jgi:PKD repeat protein